MIESRKKNIFFRQQLKTTQNFRFLILALNFEFSYRTGCCAIVAVACHSFIPLSRRGFFYYSKPFRVHRISNELVVCCLHTFLPLLLVHIFSTNPFCCVYSLFECMRNIKIHTKNTLTQHSQRFIPFFFLYFASEIFSVNVFVLCVRVGGCLSVCRRRVCVTV